MNVLLLAAGLGTRLRPLTDETPKPLMPIGGTPIIEHILTHLQNQGARCIVVNTFYHAEKLEQALKAAGPRPYELRFSREHELLGTGGGLHQMLQYLPSQDEPVLVMNADILFAPDIKSVFAMHRKTNAIATMVLRPRPVDSTATLVKTNAELRVQRIGPHSATPPHPLSNDDYMFTGAHVLSPHAFIDLPEKGCVIAQSYKRWLERGERVQAVVDTSYWRDIGTIDEYQRANAEWPSQAPRFSKE